MWALFDKLAGEVLADTLALCIGGLAAKDGAGDLAADGAADVGLLG